MSNLNTLKHFSLFTNNSDKVQFFKSKNVKVKADYSSFEPERQLSVAAIKAASDKAAGGSYMKLTVALGEQGSREYADGAMFRNQKKGDNPKAPDMTGVLTMPDKSEKRLAGWFKQSDSGVKYLSVAISEKLSKDKESEEPVEEPAPEPEAQAESEAVATSEASSDESIF